MNAVLPFEEWRTLFLSEVKSLGFEPDPDRAPEDGVMAHYRVGRRRTCIFDSGDGVSVVITEHEGCRPLPKVYMTRCNTTPREAALQVAVLLLRGQLEECSQKAEEADRFREALAEIKDMPPSVFTASHDRWAEGYKAAVEAVARHAQGALDGYENE